MSKQTPLSPTCTHWGNYLIESDGKSILAVHPYEVDAEPTPIGQSLLNALDEGARIPQPMVRAGYLEQGRNSDGSGRGVEPFVPVSWDTALDLAADALRHTMDNNGPSSVFGGSYGWSSAGRFHHAQSQIHRFLGQLGGYVDSVNSYSSAAAEVIINHVLGIPFLKLVREAPPCGEIAQHAKTLVLFGGAAIKNTQVNAGGIGTHSARQQLIELQAAGVEIVNISPVRDDVISELDARWLACRPGSDVAIMLGLAHTLASENLYDREFIGTYTVGFDRFLPYLLGEADGQPKDADWAGGNPFHHHQDLKGLSRAWAKPETIIVNECFWTATARHADIVFPCTTTMERNDVGGSSYDAYLSPMRQAVNPYQQARHDFDVFSALASRLGFEERFTEGRTEMEWVQHIYAVTRENAASKGVALPDFDSFWQGEQYYVGDQLQDAEFALERFRRDPKKYPLRTPSGKIEIFSERIAGFGYDDCQGHPRWYEHTEWLDSERASEFPLHLVSNQPKTRLHSQYDHGVTSRDHKIKERERARMNASDASARNLADGDIIKVFNDRGACLAGLEISEDIRDSVIELPTGAWYDPQIVDDEIIDVHGNPNAVTRDIGTSTLAQGCSAHSCLVEVEKYEGKLPEVTVFKQPATVDK